MLVKVTINECKIMKINQTVGIDISKKTFDVRIHTSKLSEVFDNSKKGFIKMYKWYIANSDVPLNETMFVFEHTGLYSEGLAKFLSAKKAFFAIIPGLEIKRSLGLARGKSDKKDAASIALYAYRRRGEIKPQEIATKNIRSIKKLLSLRDRLVRQRAGYKASYKEQKRVLDQKVDSILLDTQLAAIDSLNN